MFMVLVYKDGDAYEYVYDRLEDAQARFDEDPKENQLIFLGK